MNKVTTRVFTAVAATLAVVAGVVLPAGIASASIPAGTAQSVTCPSGSGTCTEWRYGFYLPGATGQFGIYYTGQWSSSLGSYKIVKVRWVNNSDRTVYFGDYSVFDAAQNTEYFLGDGGSSSAYAIGAGSSYTFYESSFNGAGKGHFVAHNHGSYANSWSGIPSWEYHVSGYSGIQGAFTLG